MTTIFGLNSSGPFDAAGNQILTVLSDVTSSWALEDLRTSPNYLMWGRTVLSTASVSELEAANAGGALAPALRLQCVGASYAGNQSVPVNPSVATDYVRRIFAPRLRAPRPPASGTVDWLRNMTYILPLSNLKIYYNLKRGSLHPLLIIAPSDKPFWTTPRDIPLARRLVMEVASGPGFRHLLPAFDFKEGHYFDFKLPRARVSMDSFFGI
ncbi:hypothetical protein K438DRAFT_1962714 [Mycena galopus ATCC 62051]|nr:hypothetical protein K438DRAFT_1962714 [Mycena galopus ATCC 62051]